MQGYDPPPAAPIAELFPELAGYPAPSAPPAVGPRGQTLPIARAGGHHPVRLHRPGAPARWAAPIMPSVGRGNRPDLARLRRPRKGGA